MYSSIGLKALLSRHCGEAVCRAHADGAQRHAEHREAALVEAVHRHVEVLRTRGETLFEGLPRLLVLEPADVAHRALRDFPLRRETALCWPSFGSGTSGSAHLRSASMSLVEPIAASARRPFACGCVRSWSQKITASSACSGDLLALVRVNHRQGRRSCAPPRRARRPCA